ncbi:hypothetical protein TH47_05955 [Thalassospira sp. MCCC 1A02803]|nr:hypothetical protein TH47_05955 [Thalassospira sp. MCCC 1A02803]
MMIAFDGWFETAHPEAAAAKRQRNGFKAFQDAVIRKMGK